MALRIEPRDAGFFIVDTTTANAEGPMTWDEAIRRVGRLILHTTIAILLWEGQTP